jgi:hypothetical protein
MKPYEISRDIFLVGGPEITDGRDGCVYLINLGELIIMSKPPALPGDTQSLTFSGI